MGRLIERLQTELGPSLRVGAPVRRIGLRQPGFDVELDGETLAADAVLLAAPAHVAASLVPDSELSRELAAIRYTSTATVFFAFDRESVLHPLQGSGFVVPKGVIHRTRAPERAVILMVESAAIVPTGD